MRLVKYIGKIDQSIHNIGDHIDINLPIFTDGKNFYWFMVEYTDNDEMVIHDTCGRVMPLPVEICGELADLLHCATRVKETQEAFAERFDRPTTSAF